MFTESLLESSGLHQRSHRGWTTAASIMLQVIVIGTFALVPILYPEALSLVRKPPEIPIFSSPAPPPVNATPHPATATPETATQVTFISSNKPLTFGPARPEIGTDTQLDPNPPHPPGLVNTGLQNIGVTPVAPVRPVLPPHPTRLSHPDPASLIHYVKPIYPSIALISHTQGTVTLHAIISKDGTVESLQLVNGHPLLARAALDAVKQWRYRPYILNGEAVEVETQITVNFISTNN